MEERDAVRRGDRAAASALAASARASAEKSGEEIYFALKVVDVVKTIKSQPKSNKRPILDILEEETRTLASFNHRYIVRLHEGMSFRGKYGHERGVANRHFLRFAP
jgi:hypothetical protein